MRPDSAREGHDDGEQSKPTNPRAIHQHLLASTPPEWPAWKVTRLLLRLKRDGHLDGVLGLDPRLPGVAA